MRVLLLIPPTDLKKSYGKLKEFSNPQPSIGIAYIGAVLRENRYDVKVVDAYVNGYSLEKINEIVKQFAPDVIGISVLTPSGEIVYEISKNIRITFPQIKIVMGNLHASLFCDEILSMNYADFVVHGEGELTMLELMKAIENGANYEQVKGISFKRNGIVINNGISPHIANLDELPYPAWDLFDMDKYSTDPRTQVKKGNVDLQILTSRGCPNQCTFCSSRTERSLGSKYRMRAPKAVVDEMVYMHNNYGKEVFNFMDLAFPLVRKHAIDLCNELIIREVNKNFKWINECRVKPLDEELLILMKKAGCVRICFGIESGNDATLELLKKNFTTEDVRRAVKMVQRIGIDVDGMFMMGLPGETEDMIKKTINFAIELDLRYAIFNIFVPYPGCELYDTLNKENEIHFERWSDFTSYPTYAGGTPVYVPKGLSHKQMMSLQRYAMKSFYLRPRFIWNELKRMKFSQIKRYYYGLKGIIS